eukprot:6202579-Pleurochrysis_carterae.AAC.2
MSISPDLSEPMDKSKGGTAAWGTWMQDKKENVELRLQVPSGTRGRNIHVRGAAWHCGRGPGEPLSECREYTAKWFWKVNWSIRYTDLSRCMQSCMLWLGRDRALHFGNGLCAMHAYFVACAVIADECGWQLDGAEVAYTRPHGPPWTSKFSLGSCKSISWPVIVSTLRNPAAPNPVHSAATRSSPVRQTPNLSLSFPVTVWLHVAAGDHAQQGEGGVVVAYRNAGSIARQRTRVTPRIHARYIPDTLTLCPLREYSILPTSTLLVLAELAWIRHSLLDLAVPLWAYTLRASPSSSSFP